MAALLLIAGGAWLALALQAGEHYVAAETAQPVLSDAPVSCGIPGHDRPGQEFIAEVFQMDDGALHWNVSGRCGFASSFAYSSDES
jgi:hypothetical protein